VRRGERRVAEVVGRRERLRVEIWPLPVERGAGLERVVESAGSKRLELVDLLLGR